MMPKKKEESLVHEFPFAIWNRETLKARSKGYTIVPSMTISPSCGRIGFNVSAVKLLGLGQDTGVEFIQSGIDMGELYVVPSSLSRAMKVIVKGSGACFCCTELCDRIAKSLNRNNGASTFRVQLAAKPTLIADPQTEGGVITAYALITLNVKDILKKGGKR